MTAESLAWLEASFSGDIPKSLSGIQRVPNSGYFLLALIGNQSESAEDGAVPNELGMSLRQDNIPVHDPLSLLRPHPLHSLYLFPCFLPVFIFSSLGLTVPAEPSAPCPPSPVVQLKLRSGWTPWPEALSCFPARWTQMMLSSRRPPKPNSNWMFPFEWMKTV